MARKRTDSASQIQDLRKVLWEVYISKDIPESLRSMVRNAISPEDFLPTVGCRVNYYSVIGKDVTLSNVVVRSVGMLSDGKVYAWLEGKAGCVDVRHLSPVETETS